jgi:predicted RecA/RadA family phage recombinase
MAAPNLKGGIVEYSSPSGKLTMTVGAGGVVGGNIVALSANRTVVKAGVADHPIGVALHDAAAGEIVTIATQGVWPCKASGAVGFGDTLVVGAAGTVLTDNSAPDAALFVGVALESIADTASGRVKLRL